MSASTITQASNYTRRKWTDQFMRGLTVVATLLALAPLFSILGYVVYRGGAGLITFPDDYTTYELSMESLVTMMKDRTNPHYDRALLGEAVQLEKKLKANIQQARAGGDTSELQAERTELVGSFNQLAQTTQGVSFDSLGKVGLSYYFSFFVETYQPPEFNAPTDGSSAGSVQSRGGVLHGIIGTFLIVGASMLIAMPVGIMAGVFLSEYPSNVLANTVRFATDVLSAAPSIIVGVVAYVLIVQRTSQFSGIAGSVALSVLMVPVVTRTTEEMLKLVPSTVREAAMGLGAPKWWTTISVVIPAATSGIVTGALLAFARAAGETAPLLLTILGNNQITFDLLKPMAALPLMTYKYTESPFPSQNDLAWTSALILTSLVLFVNITARWATRNRVK